MVEGGGYRCPQHPISYTPKRRYDHQYHQGKYIYGTAWWKKLRDLQLIKQPLCEMCLQFDIITEATVVDHIIEVKDGGEARDPDNLQSLCRACHQKKTGDEIRKRRKKKSGFKSVNDF